MVRFHQGAQRASSHPRRRWSASLAILLTVGALAPAPAPAAAATATIYTVSMSGSDSNSGSWSRPWRTIQKAANSARAGSIIQIRGGTYGAFVVTRPSLTFRRFGTETVAVNATSTRPNAIRISATHDVTIQGLVAQNGPSRWGAGVRIERGSYRITVYGSTLRYNRSYGVMIDSSTDVRLVKNNIYRNETGVQVSYAGAGVVITGNRIHDNDRMIINDSTAYNDRGANGIVFYKTTGPVQVTSNTIYGNRARSHDYGYDGGAFEIYGASNITIRGNTMYDNQNVIETGTDGVAPCENIQFVRNRAFGGADGGLPSQGLVLRCMANSLIANNSFSDLSEFVYYVTQSGGFVGSLTGLEVRNNIARQPGTKIYSFQSVPAGVSFDHDLVWNASRTSIAWVNGKGNTPSLATFRSWTGFEQSGIQADPQFISSTSLGLKTTSPAIDRGMVIPGVTDGFLGSAPDLGRWEVR